MNAPRTLRRLSCRARRAAARGQSTVEYIVVTSFAVLILIEGGNSSPVQQVVGAIKQVYRGFTFALGYATHLNIL